MALPLSTIRSLRPAFAPARGVPLAVKLPFAFTLDALISDQGKGTFAHLRYSLGGDRPSQTARLTLSAPQLHGPALEILSDRAGISPTAPRTLTRTPPSLPAILHMSDRIPALGCGEGSRGLSV